MTYHLRALRAPLLLAIAACLGILLAEQQVLAQSFDNGVTETNGTNTVSFNGTQVNTPTVSGFPQGFAISSTYNTATNLYSTSGVVPIMQASGAGGVMENNVYSTFVNGSYTPPFPNCSGSGNYCSTQPVSIRQGIRVDGPADPSGRILGPVINGQPSVIESITYTCGSTVRESFVDSAQRTAPSPPSSGCIISYNFVAQDTEEPIDHTLPTWDVNPKNFTHSALINDPAPAADLVTMTSDRTLDWYATTDQTWCKVRFTDGSGTRTNTALYGTYSIVNTYDQIYIVLEAPQDVGGGSHTCKVTFKDIYRTETTKVVSVAYNITSLPGCSQVKNVQPTGTVGSPVNLSWNPVAGATNYLVRVNDNTDNSYNTDPAKSYRYPGGTWCGAGFHYVCEQAITSSPMNNIPLVAGHNYSAWVHARVGGTVCESSPVAVFERKSLPSVDLKERVDVADASWWTSNQTATDGPITIPNQTPVRLSWTSSNVDWCTLPGLSTALSHAGLKTGAISQTVTFTIMCGNNFGDIVSDSVTVQIPGMPTNYNAICNGTQVSANWSGSTDGLSYSKYTFRAYDASMNFPPASYVASYEHITSSSTTFAAQSGKSYTWFVHNEAANGAWSNVSLRNVSCSVVPTPTVTANIWADSTSVTSGQSTVIHWTVQNSTSAVLTSSPADPQFNNRATTNTVGASDNTSNLTQNTTYTITAQGPGGPTTKNVTVLIDISSINGQCGPADGTYQLSAPSGVSLCGYSSTIPTVNGAGPWTWTCTGSGGGDNASCSANLATGPVDGVCGPADTMTLASLDASSPDLCLSGSVWNFHESGAYWVWVCSGSHIGTIDETCAANMSSSPPPGPTGASVNASSNQCGRIDVTWTDVSGETGYHVYRSTINNPATATLAGNAAQNATAYSITGLASGTYYVWVSAYNAEGESSRIAANSGTPVGVTECGSNLSLSDKDIIEHNSATLPAPGFCDNSFDMPPVTEVFHIGDIVKFRVRLCNSSTNQAAVNISVADTLVNLVQPTQCSLSNLSSCNSTNPVHWNMVYTGGALTSSNLSLSGTAPNQTLTITLPGTIPATASAGNPEARELTFEARIVPPATFTGNIGRFQNRAVIYYDKMPGNQVIKTTQTSLMYFYGENASPEIIEVPPR